LLAGPDRNAGRVFEISEPIRDYHDSRFASVSAVRSKFVPGDRSTKRSETKPPFREVRTQLKSCIRGPFRSAFRSGVCRTPLHDLHATFTSHLASHRMCSIHCLHPIVNTCSEHRKKHKKPLETGQDVEATVVSDRRRNGCGTGDVKAGAADRAYSGPKTACETAMERASKRPRNGYRDSAYCSSGVRSVDLIHTSVMRMLLRARGEKKLRRLGRMASGMVRTTCASCGSRSFGACTAVIEACRPLSRRGPHV
jgi:hypothetical protein